MFAKMRSSRGVNLLVDLVMIIVGINIALWFEGLAEEIQERETEQHYLAGLRDDLETDLANLEILIRESRGKVEQLQAIIPTLDNVDQQPGEKVAEVIFAPSSYYFFQPSDFTYTSMQESGDFRLLSDPGVKKDILRLVRHYRLIDDLQRNFIQAMDSEYIPLIMSGYDLVGSSITDPSLVKNQVFRNFFPYTMKDTATREHIMSAAQEQAVSLLEDIEAQLN